MDKYQSSSEYSREYEELFRTAFEYSTDGMALVDLNGRWLRVNTALCRILGHNEAELLNMRFQEITHPDDRAEGIDVAERLIKGRIATIQLDKRYVQRSGRTVWAQVSVSLVRDSEGSPLYFVSQTKDITERKQSEFQISRLNRLYAVLSRCGAAIVRARSENELFQDVCRIAVESGGFPIAWVGELDMVTSQVVPVAKAGKAAGYLDEIDIAAEGPLSSGPTGTCLREGRAVASKDFQADPGMAPWRSAAARYGLRSSICLPFSCRGRTVSVFGLYSIEPDFFREEETKLAVEIGESVSFALDRMALDRERLTAEAERQETRKRLELIMDAAGEACWDWNVNTGDWYTSPRYHTMLGYEPCELKPGLESITATTHPDDQTLVKGIFQDLLQGKRDGSSAEFRLRHKDGHDIWIMSRSRVVARNQDGSPQRIVGTRTDITEHKQLQEQFLQAQKLESIGRLAGGVAHDFNNHLTVINGYANLLRSRVQPDSQLGEGLRHIRDAGERAAALTQQLLTFSRKQVTRPEPLNLNNLIHGIENMLRRLLGEDVDLQLALAPHVDALRADPTQLEQVVMNLAVNARDAINQGGRVTIATEQTELKRDPVGHYVRLTVSDNGCGMSSEVLDHIFEPFYTTKERGRGTGLGLSTVFGIVRDSGGFLKVESTPGEGSSFHAYFPCMAEAVAETKLSDISEDELRGGETIMVVEDQIDVRHFTVSVLENYGYRVLEASDGNEALKIAADYRDGIDAVVTDVVMPGLSSREMSRRLLAMRPHLKIIYVSGYPAGEDIEDERKIPGTEYIQKPYAPEVLLVKLRALLSTSR